MVSVESVGLPYLQALPRRSVNLLLRTPAATTATSVAAVERAGVFSCLTACTRGPLFRAGAP
jgi:hypothetical protein